MSQSDSTSPLFVASYVPPAGVYDEFLDKSGVRAHWRFMGEVLNDPQGQWAQAQDESIQRLLSESSVIYFSDGARRPWELDGHY